VHVTLKISPAHTKHGREYGHCQHSQRLCHELTLIPAMGRAAFSKPRTTNIHSGHRVQKKYLVVQPNGRNASPKRPITLSLSILRKNNIRRLNARLRPVRLSCTARSSYRLRRSLSLFAPCWRSSHPDPRAYLANYLSKAWASRS
jgi:hypothetical protein